MNSQLQIMIEKALVAFENNDLIRSTCILKKIIKIDSTIAFSYHLLGLIQSSQGNYREAIDCLKTAVEIDPNDAIVQYNLAKALADHGLYQESLIHHKHAARLAPNRSEVWLNYGKANYDLYRHKESISCYDKALNLKPDYAEAWSNKGVTLNELKRYDEAIAHYDKALNLKPDYAEAWSNKGVTLNELKHYDEAIAHYDKALNLKPDYAKGWFNKGVTLNELKRYDEAIAHYKKALSHEPEIDWALGDLLHLKIKTCDWLDLPKSLENLSKKLLANKRASTPFQLLSLCDDPILHKKSAEIYVQSKCPSHLDLETIAKYSKKEKIRIAYFSPDFKNHPISLLTAELFNIHDKDKFEIFAFSLKKAPAADLVHNRLKQSFDKFIDIECISDNQVTQLARKLEIDIAIDLAGHTQYSRVGIFAGRAAPIQVNWLGYPGTTGSDFIDYIVADKTIIPESHQQFYTEKVAYLPNTYMVDDTKRVASSKKFTRENFGLPDEAFVFCCFNNDYKFNPMVLDTWSRILLKVENAVLWISENHKLFKENLIIEFQKRGIFTPRIIFAPKLDLMEDYLARYALADLFLDTYPYNAHTTAVDSLKAGTPILTLIGQSFASRVAASLLNAIGLPELITGTQEEYEALAIELAKSPQKLIDIKLKLKNNRLTAPLFDTPLFTKNLEAAYIEMHGRYQAGLRPDHIYVF